ncbi:MAG: pilus assembly protein [Agarilytica sp.]
MLMRQNGSTLLISLILLLLFTVIGMTSVGNVSLNQKMSANYRDSDLAFHAAEAALAEGEAYAEILSVDLMEDYLAVGCTGDDCFTAECVEGRCFNGSYSSGTVCDVDEPSPLVALNDDTWDVGGRARESEINFSGLEQAPKYIVEFMCYVQADPSAAAPPAPPYAAADWSYFYRITSYAIGANGTSRIMLQSTYKVIR